MGNYMRILFLCLLFLFCCKGAPLYAEYVFSAFVFYEITDDARNDLEMVEYNYSWILGPSNRTPQHIKEYNIYNHGDIYYSIRLGISYQQDYSIPEDLEFQINGVRISHKETRLVIQSGLSDPFAYVDDVIFLPHTITRIQINSWGGYSTLSYNEKGGYEQYTMRGIPRFAVTIKNAYLDVKYADLGVEEIWITDIKVRNSDDGGLTSVLKETSSLSNEFFNLRKTSANTWEIEFTKQFVESRQGSFYLTPDTGIWGWDDLYSFPFNCEEKLEPYQYIFLTSKQLQVIRNAYYARHGYIFKNMALKKMYLNLNQETFGGINYRENPNFSESMLTDTDRANIETIRRLEQLAGQDMQR
jgi:hypothetical protein